MKWHPLQHKIWRELRQVFSENKLSKTKFLLCVSGGADSMALFWAFRDLPVEIEVFHAHHGPGNHQTYRDLARSFVQEAVTRENKKFVTTQSSGFLRSEKDLRDFRRDFLKKWSQENPGQVIVMAHHSQDLLETRIMRLIRGTSLEGLGSMQVWKAPVLRPFLAVEPCELKEFLFFKQKEWIEDPSNQESRYFRNWMRQKWLPLLEKKRPGSLKRWAQSLENLLPGPVSLNTQGLKLQDLSRSYYESLSEKQKLQALAHVLRNHGVIEFSRGQLQEIAKRLDNSKTRLMFELAGVHWSADAQRIRLKRL